MSIHSKAAKTHQSWWWLLDRHPYQANIAHPKGHKGETMEDFTLHWKKYPEVSRNSPQMNILQGIQHGFEITHVTRFPFAGCTSREGNMATPATAFTCFCSSLSRHSVHRKLKASPTQGFKYQGWSGLGVSVFCQASGMQTLGQRQ